MYCILTIVVMMSMLRGKRNVKHTTCLCFVALFQTDVDLHNRHMLDLNLQPKSGLEQDVKG